VAVVTNIGTADHLGLAYIDTPEQMFTVKRCGVDVVLPTGSAVLKADDPLVAEMAPLCAGDVIFFALDAECPVICDHRARQKRAVFARGGSLVFAEGNRESTVTALAQLPMTHRGRVPFQIENVLAAAAAAWALGLPPEVIRSGLESFRGDAGDNPGRFNVFDWRGTTVIVDDCHNVGALTALVAALENFPHERRTIVYSAGDGRRDVDIVRQGEILGSAFDRVILYVDPAVSDRSGEKLVALFGQGLREAIRVSTAVEVTDPAAAINAALAGALPGELVVLQTADEDIDLTMSLVRSRLCQELPAGQAMWADSGEGGAGPVLT
jgi:cyanophycin synthetase